MDILWPRWVARIGISDWKEVCEKRTARDKSKYHTVRSGYLTEFHPKSVPLPEPESLPATDAILKRRDEAR